MSVNIRKADFFKLPAQFRKILDGRPHVLTTTGHNTQRFIPANII